MNQKKDCPRFPGTPCECNQIRKPPDSSWLSEIKSLQRINLNRDDDTRVDKTYQERKTVPVSPDTPGFLPLKYARPQ